MAQLLDEREGYPQEFLKWLEECVLPPGLLSDRKAAQADSPSSNTCLVLTALLIAGVSAIAIVICQRWLKLGVDMFMLGFLLQFIATF